MDINNLHDEIFEQFGKSLETVKAQMELFELHDDRLEGC